jgi:hypothetical protein
MIMVTEGLCGNPVIINKTRILNFKTENISFLKIRER